MQFMQFDSDLKAISSALFVTESLQLNGGFHLPFREPCLLLKGNCLSGRDWLGDVTIVIYWGYARTCYRILECVYGTRNVIGKCYLYSKSQGGHNMKVLFVYLCIYSLYIYVLLWHTSNYLQ